VSGRHAPGDAGAPRDATSAAEATSTWLDEAYHVERPGADLYVEQVGRPEAAPVYFLHGGPGYHASAFRELMGEELEAYRMIYADQRGGGRSYADAPFDLDVLADDVQGVVTALERQSPPWRQPLTLLAHGFGATIAVRAAARHPELVARLVLVNPWTSMPMLARTLQRTAAGLSDQLDAAVPPESALADGLELDPEGLIEDAFGWVSAKVLFDTLLFPNPAARLRLEHADATALFGPTETVELAHPWRVDVLADLSQLRCQVVLVAGTRDASVFPDQAEALLRRLPQALSGLLDVGHYPWLDDPDAFVALLRDALPGAG